MVQKRFTKQEKLANAMPAEEVDSLINSKLVSMTPEGLGAWSFSKLKLLQQCPLQFYLKYVLKVKVAQPPRSLITEVGKAAHRVLEFMIGGKTIQDSFKAARLEYLETLSDAEWEEHVASLEYSVTRFRQRLDEFEAQHKVRAYHQELRIGCTRAWGPTTFFAKNVFFRGVIDLAIELESRDLILIDHKTGLPAACGIRNNEAQLRTYKVLFHRGIRPIAGAQAGIHFIRDAEVKLTDYVPKEKIDTDLINELELYLDGAIEAVVDAGVFDSNTKSSACKYCDYAAQCKSGVYAPLIEASKKHVLGS